jgi:hypothetical protein
MLQAFLILIEIFLTRETSKVHFILAQNFEENNAGF